MNKQVEILAYGEQLEERMAVLDKLFELTPKREGETYLWSSRYYNAKWYMYEKGELVLFVVTEPNSHAEKSMLLLSDSFDDITEKMFEYAPRISEEDKQIVREHVSGNIAYIEQRRKEILAMRESSQV